MPWNHCGIATILDDQPCPGCGVTKNAWTVQLEATRTFQVRRGTSRVKRTAWVAFALREGAAPVAGARYALELPDGQSVEGELDRDGLARHEQLSTGECRLRFEDVARRRARLVGADDGQPVEGEPDAEGWLALATGRTYRLELPRAAVDPRDAELLFSM